MKLLGFALSMLLSSGSLLLAAGTDPKKQAPEENLKKEEPQRKEAVWVEIEVASGEFSKKESAWVSIDFTTKAKSLRITWKTETAKKVEITPSISGGLGPEKTRSRVRPKVEPSRNHTKERGGVMRFQLYKELKTGKNSVIKEEGYWYKDGMKLPGPGYRLTPIFEPDFQRLSYDFPTIHGGDTSGRIISVVPGKYSLRTSGEEIKYKLVIEEKQEREATGPLKE